MKNNYSLYYNDNVIQNFSNEEEMAHFIINNDNKIPYKFIAIGKNLYLLAFCNPRFFCAYNNKRYAPRFVIKNNNFLNDEEK